MKKTTDKKLITECWPTEHDYQSVSGSFYPEAATLGGIGAASLHTTKIYCRKCGKVIAI